MRLMRGVLASFLLALVLAGAGCWHSGYRVYIVHTGSMVPTYYPGDIVIDKAAHSSPGAGQVITFRHDVNTTDVVTHRVTGVTSTGLIHTKGDANATADVWNIRPDMVQGQVIRAVPRLGYLLVFLRQPAGIGALACSLFSLCLLWSMFFGSDDPLARTAGRHSGPARPEGQVRYFPIVNLLD
jgi:signal peptidase